MKDTLNSLPVLSKKVSLFWTDYLLDGKRIQRNYIHKIVVDHVRLSVMTFAYQIKGKLAKKLLRDHGDNCPYCHHIIDLGRWEKLFPEVELEVKRKDTHENITRIH